MCQQSVNGDVLSQLNFKYCSEALVEVVVVSALSTLKLPFCFLAEDVQQVKELVSKGNWLWKH